MQVSDTEQRMDTLIGQFETEIVDYLRLRPDAADDLSGVTHWWLCHYRYVQNVTLVQRALNKLVERQWVSCTHSTVNRPIYSAGPRLKFSSDASGSVSGEGDH